jgi:hypothetical protein
MQRLNIPFDRHKQTTRRNGRVVWLYVGFFLLFFVTVWITSNIVLSRDTLGAATPENTVLTLRFETSKNNLSEITELLENIPLVSERNITTSTILPITQGEFAIFLLSDGTHSLGLRTQKERIPYGTLDSLGITVQEITPTTFLLSQKNQPLSTTDLGRSWRFPYVWLGTKRIGTLRYHGDIVQNGSILSKQGRISFVFPTDVRMNAQTLPDTFGTGVFGAMSTPALSNTDTVGISHNFSLLTKWLDTPNIDEFIQTILKEPGYILLSEESETPFFLISTTSTVLSKDAQNGLLKTISALKSPSLRELLLPDNTVSQEIIADPTKTTIEERVILGTPVLHTNTGSKEDFYIASTDERVGFSNNETLLTEWISPESMENTTEPLCGANIAFLNLNTLENLSRNTLSNYDTSLLRSVSSNYSSIGFAIRRKKIVVSLCNS